MGSWLEAISVGQKEEAIRWKMIRRGPRTACGNMGGIQGRENGIGKGQRMNRKGAVKMEFE